MRFAHEPQQVVDASKSQAIRLQQLFLLCVAFVLALNFEAEQNCFAEKVNDKPTLCPLQKVASILGRPVERLRVLDRRPLLFAFLEGQYEVYVVRDLTTDETLEIALDLNSGRRVDPVELRKLDRECATVQGRKLEPRLLDLLLCHPNLPRIDVRLYFDLESVRYPGESPQMDWLEPALRERFQACLDAELRQLAIDVPIRVRSDFPILEATLSAIHVVKLSRSLLIQSIELVAEPEILNSSSRNLILGFDIDKPTASNTNAGLGTEYWYQNLIALRPLYLNKEGNVKGLTRGIGLRYRE